MNDMFDRLSKLSPKRLALLAMELQERLDEHERASSEPVAVIGMGCRLPGASTPDEYWTMLIDGVDAIAEVPPERWDVDEFYDPDPDVPGKAATRWAGMLTDIDRFEPEMFGISPREATTMDPQQRLLLEVAWETLENAGIAPDDVHGSSTGAYIGVCNTDYARLLMDGDDSDLDMYLSTGNASSVASGRLSYVLGLQGPAMTVDTACSSSLVAVHLAVQAVRAGECRMALAGGANVILSPQSTIILSQAQMMASDGRCKTFDASGDGFVRGEGCGLVALKRLSDARADGDRVLAVIRGSAVNQDGRSNGITAPNGPSQVAVLRAALDDAGIAPHDVGYVEAHGTGTSLGDPIEVQSLGSALGAGRDPSNRLVVGSAKSNVGHLEAAAGIAGLIKLILTLRHGEFAPLLHLKNPNPHIPWADLAIDVPTERTPWESERPRIGGVSSFGFSGTNAHLLVEAVASEPAPHDAELRARTEHVLTLSARTAEALDALAAKVGSALETTPRLSGADLERTLDVGRNHLAHRLVVVTDDVGGAGRALTAWAGGDSLDDAVHSGATVLTGIARASRPPEVGFLFTGHGSHFPDMGRDLYDTSGPFRAAIDRCEELLAPLLDVALTTVMYDRTRSDALLADMAYAQPAVFAIEYALAEVWRSFGVRPSVVAGHSVGEYVAAVVAGAMSLDDGLRLVAARGRLMATLPPDGEMATVFASEDRVREAIDRSESGVTIAAVNGPQSIALSGTGGGLQPLLDELVADGVDVRPLAIPIAAHSPQIDPILDEFEAVAATVSFTTPHIDVVSGMTGQLARGDDLVSATYWRDHLRRPVRFADAFATMHGGGVRTFVEVGPHPTLLNMARHIVDEHECRWLPTLRKGRSDWRQVLESVAELHVAGVPLSWPAIAAPGGSVVTLPTYPFQRERHWATSSTRRLRRSPDEHPLLGARLHSPALRHVVFENELSATWPAFLDHHRVFGTALMPSPAYLEMVLAAGDLLDGPGTSRFIERFEIREALTLPEVGERSVQVVVHDDPPADGAPTSARDFEVFSRASDTTDDWTLHATGRLSNAATATTSTIDVDTDLDEIRARCDTYIDGAEYYERLAELGLEFGRSFRGVEEIWRRDGEALGRIALQPDLHAERHQFAIHPAMLDACFHVLGAAMGLDGENTYLLIGADEFRLHGAPGTQLWNHTTLRSGSDGADDQMISGDIQLYDDEGRLVAEALGLHLRLAHRDALMRTARHTAQDWTYEVTWREFVLSPVDSEPDTPDTPMRWIVVGDGDGIGDAIAAELETRGIAQARAESADAVAEAAKDGRARVVSVGSLDHPGDPGAAAIEATETFQRLMESTDDGDVWFVTRGAQPADRPISSIDQAPTWGLARVFGLEHPEFWGGLVDVDPDEPDLAVSASKLVDTIERCDGEDQFALRGDRRLVPRLVRAATADADTIAWRSDRAYLVTGGLGGLGLGLLDWLARNGAGTIVLTGRTAFPPRTQWDEVEPDSRTARQVAAIRGAESAGATVVTVTADVADDASMRRLFERFGADLPPLAGVVHAAVALGNVSTDEMSSDDIRSMFRPKITGTELLHELTAHLALDFFVMFSSTSALWGSRELGHYAAANHYLDAMAYRRHELGLPALSVNWGTWDEMRVASTEERAEVARGGMHPMATDVALSLLERLLARPELAHIAVADVDWTVLKPLYEARRARPFLADVAPLQSARRAGRSRQDVTTAHLATRLADAADDARRSIVVDYLRDEVARALGITDARTIDVDQGMFEMGMDSLMSVELKTRVESALGTNLPSTVTFNYPNIDALAGYIVDEVLASPAGEPPPAESADPGDEPGATSLPTEDMSEDDLAAMLASRLSKLQDDR